MKASAESEGQTILIVDDVPANLSVMVDHLETQGFQVLVAQNGEEALQRSEFAKPDLILLDVMMPGIDGFEVCRRLKLNPATQSIPVIFMTALTDTGSTVAGFEAGAVDYITKPFKIAEVLARVNTHLAAQAMQRQLVRRNAELSELNAKLSMAQAQLVQSDKLASIGQLAAGVAHEINNPIGFVCSNVATLKGYLDGLFELLAAYQAAECMLNSPHLAATLRGLRERVELELLRDDIPCLMSETKDGIVRVRKIVQDLRDFSRVDSNHDWQWSNLHQGIDSTLNIVASEIKYKADVVKDYGQIPEIECLPSQLNQVVMNLAMNAAHAIGPERGKITIRTGMEGADGGHVWIEIADTGAGIATENLSRIFDPFFTTKPIGKGTGLGLSLSYGIIEKHQGRIEVRSEVGHGTTFRIVLPVRQSAPDHAQDGGE
ncbi:MAG: response regulator [Rhodocyclaceae bacterium]